MLYMQKQIVAYSFYQKGRGLKWCRSEVLSWRVWRKQVVTMPYVLISTQIRLVRIDLLDTVFIGRCFSVQVNVNWT